MCWGDRNSNRMSNVASHLPELQGLMSVVDQASKSVNRVAYTPFSSSLPTANSSGENDVERNESRKAKEANSTTLPSALPDVVNVKRSSDRAQKVLSGPTEILKRDYDPKAKTSLSSDKSSLVKPQQQQKFDHGASESNKTSPNLCTIGSAVVKTEKDSPGKNEKCSPDPCNKLCSPDSFKKRKRLLEAAAITKNCPMPVEDGTMTDKGHKRSHVRHNYHDYSSYSTEDASALPDFESERAGKGGITSPFPIVLYQMLDGALDQNYSDVVSWQPHGRAFHVHDQDRFVKQVMTRFFRQTRFSSFQRQLSLYGFLRLTRKGPDHGAYYHELCLRGMPHLCAKIQRTRIKGYGVRPASDPETEPDFYNMPYAGNDGINSSDKDRGVGNGEFCDNHNASSSLMNDGRLYFTSYNYRNTSVNGPAKAEGKKCNSMPALSASLPIDHLSLMKNTSFSVAPQNGCVSSTSSSNQNHHNCQYDPLILQNHTFPINPAGLQSSWSPYPTMHTASSSFDNKCSNGGKQNNFGYPHHYQQNHADNNTWAPSLKLSQQYGCYPSTTASSSTYDHRSTDSYRQQQQQEQQQQDHQQQQQQQRHLYQHQPNSSSNCFDDRKFSSLQKNQQPLHHFQQQQQQQQSQLCQQYFGGIQAGVKASFDIFPLVEGTSDDLVAFLSDVELSGDEGEDQTYRNEDELGRIFAMKQQQGHYLQSNNNCDNNNNYNNYSNIMDP